jgi:hypothetical protein
VVHEGSELYADAVARGYLLKHAYTRTQPATPDAVIYREGQRFIDFSRPHIRAWWWDAHRHLCDLGIAGWWLDGGEGPPAGTVLAGGDAALVHNRYDLWRQQAFAEGEARDRPDRRPFMLCRSGSRAWHGSGDPWSGDISPFSDGDAIHASDWIWQYPASRTSGGPTRFYSVAPDHGGCCALAAVLLSARYSAPAMSGGAICHGRRRASRQSAAALIEWRQRLTIRFLRV